LFIGLSIIIILLIVNSTEFTYILLTYSSQFLIFATGSLASSVVKGRDHDDGHDDGHDNGHDDGKDGHAFYLPDTI